MRHGGDGLPWPVVVALFAATWAAVIAFMFAVTKPWRQQARSAKPWRLPEPQPREDTRPYAAMDGVTIGYTDDPGHQDPG